MYPNIKDEKFMNKLIIKQEFRELINDIKINYKFPFLNKHQEFVRRYMSPYTNYDRILLYHSTGSGKSFTAISVAETHKHMKKKCLVLVKGKTSMNNFYKLIKEFYKKAYGSYDKKEIYKYYEFDRFIRFSKNISNFSKNDIKHIYSNRIIILDEVHNIKNDKDHLNITVYNNIHNMLHTIENSKILLLTATPMVDNVEEIYPLLNLLLDETSQFNNKEFDNFSVLKNKVKGLISHTDVKYNIPKILNKGINIPYIEKKIFISYMKGYQLEAWKKLVNNDEIINREDFDYIYKNRIYCSTMCYKDLTFGNKMKSKYINEVNTANGKMFKFNNKNSITIKDLEILSCKFYNAIKLSIKCKGPVYIFCEDIEGSGLKILSSIFDAIGYKMFFNWNHNISKDKRFILCTGDETISPRIDDLIENFCRNENKHGEYIKFFLGSRVVGESINLKNVKQIHVITPHWNNPVIDQVIGRAIRNGSHDNLNVTEKRVEIFLHAAVSDNNFINNKSLNKVSIDLYKYKIAQDKYKKIKEIQNILKNMSLNKYLEIENYKINNKIDYFTYYIFYKESLSKYITKTLEKLFNRNSINFLSLEELLKNVDINNYIIIKILEDEIILKKTIKNIYGEENLVYKNNNILCLMDKYLFMKNESYQKKMIKPKDIILNKTILKNNENINNVYLNIKNNNNYLKNKLNIMLINDIFNLTFNEKINLLEFGILKNDNLIKKYFKLFIFNINKNIYFHNLCYFNIENSECSYSVSSGNYTINGKTRKINVRNNTCEYVDDIEIENNIKKKTKKNINNIDYKIYLLISNSDKKYRICNRINEKMDKSLGDMRCKNRGKKIETFSFLELKKIHIYIINNISSTMWINILNNFNINKNFYNKNNFIEFIKYVLFYNNMYIIH